MAKPNYRLAKRQKEDARKARKLQKQQRRSDKSVVEAGSESAAPPQPVESGLGQGAALVGQLTK